MSTITTTTNRRCRPRSVYYVPYQEDVRAGSFRNALEAPLDGSNGLAVMLMGLVVFGIAALLFAAWLAA